MLNLFCDQVARYNSLQQNTQSMNVALSNSVLHRAKPEILSIVEHLVDKMHVEMKDLLVEVCDFSVTEHCESAKKKYIYIYMDV